MFKSTADWLESITGIMKEACESIEHAESLECALACISSAATSSLSDEAVVHYYNDCCVMVDSGSLNLYRETYPEALPEDLIGRVLWLFVERTHKVPRGDDIILKLAIPE